MTIDIATKEKRLLERRQFPKTCRSRWDLPRPLLLALPAYCLQVKPSLRLRRKRRPARTAR